MAAATLTPADLATELGTDARTTRKFLRSITPRDAQPGKGSRWEIKGTKTEIASMRKKFAAFQAAQAEAKAKREEAKAVAAPVSLEKVDLAKATGADIEDPEFLDALDALEPTDEDLQAIDAE